MILSRSRIIGTQCFAASSPKKSSNPISEARKRFESKRSDIAKGNFNKLLNIGKSETDDVGSFIKELDVLHRKAVDNLFRSDKQVEYVDAEVVDEKENIFVKSD